MKIPSETELKEFSIFEQEVFEELEDLEDPDGGDLIENLIVDYRKSSVTLMEDFKKGLSTNPSLAERSVHSLKSASAFLGGTRLSQLCAAAEANVREQTNFDQDSCTKQIESELALFKAQLEIYSATRKLSKTA